MIRAKELKDDAIINISVNKSFYLMAKAASFTILQEMNIEEKGDEYFKNIITTKYEDLDDLQRTFYTIILVLAEIEKQATNNSLFEEKELLEPGDEGYVEPTQD